MAIAAAAALSGISAQEKPPTPPPVRLALAQVTPAAHVPATGDRSILATADAVWITSRSRAEIVRVDPKSSAVAQTIALPAPPCGAMTNAFGSVWVPLCGKGLVRIDAKTNAVGATIASASATTRGAVVSAVKSIWAIADDRGTIVRIDPDANVVVAEVYTERGAAALLSAADAVWVASPSANLITRINPHTNVVTQTIKVAGGPASLVSGEGAIWTLNAASASVGRIDPKQNKVIETITLGPAGTTGELVSATGSIWVSLPGLPLARIDPRTNRLMQTFSGAGGGALAAGADALWLTATPDQIWKVDPKFIEALRR